MYIYILYIIKGIILNIFSVLCIVPSYVVIKYMYICMYVCLYFVCLCVYICLYICTYLYMCVYVNNYVCLYMCMFIYMYVCVYIKQQTCLRMFSNKSIENLPRVEELWPSRSSHCSGCLIPHWSAGLRSASISNPASYQCAPWEAGGR